MTKIDTVIITTRLNFLARYLDNLKRFEQISLDDYLLDFDTQLITERLLQLMAQAAIDINDHILSKLNPGKSETNFNSFIILGKYSVITVELARQIAPSSGLRNRLVHEYDEIDPQQVFKAISLALQQYPLYVRQVSSYLNSLSQEDG
ncbi:type VII toxin-antitoxin system HepT family RNase toxin [Nostoc sp.]|uniref:type VII toxin-antitoxin system HepT family RNase toxin n=1 Tax=Nostoc sp. TaxID=1180 RepID=UPI002FFADA4A